MSELTKRYHGVDVVRALAMLAGIPFHACLSYGLINYDWAIMTSNGHPLMDFFGYSIRIFRMPLFFFIAGFFANLVFIKNKKSFLSDRIRRITIPLIVTSLFLLPLLKSLWLTGEQPSLLFQGELKQLWSYIISTFWEPSSPELVRHSVNFAHLWFLLYLTCFSLLTYLFTKLKFNPLLSKMLRSGHVCLAVTLTFFSLLLMKGSWVDEPFTWYPKISLLFYYGVFYFYGWFAFHSRQKFDQILNQKKKWLLVLFAGVLVGGGRVYYQVFLDESLIINSTLLHAWMALGTWLLVLGSIGIAGFIAQIKRPVITYLVEASYSLYIIHLPIVVFLQILLESTEIFWLLKFLLTSTLSLILGLIIYHFLVRNKWMSRFLKGRYSIS